MSIKISYMGTKKRLANVVKNIVKDLPNGPLLDAFSGMCAVGEAIAPARQIWVNEILKFPALVSKSLFCSIYEPGSVTFYNKHLMGPFTKNYQVLEKRFYAELEKENIYLRTRDINDLIEGNNNLPYIGNCTKLNSIRKRLSKKPNTFPYRLFSITYIGSYFGVKQCIEIDSLRYAIDSLKNNDKIDDEQRDWLLISLGQVLSHINNSTGQFAQYIQPKENNIGLIIEKRKRSVLIEFFKALEHIYPLGNKEWRKYNRSYSTDTLYLLNKLKRNKQKPSIIYLDPPYTEAQYSRYYHILESLLEYRYPPAYGKGRYPDNRYQTPFSNTGKVIKSMELLIERSFNITNHLLLSYPENGLYCCKGENVYKLLKRYYKSVEIIYKDNHVHSTFGAIKESPKVPVIENIYLAST